MESVTVVMT